MNFIEVADRVFVLAHPFCDVNVTLILGDGGAVLVDTLSTGEQARELSGHIRQLTTAPLTLVNTHFHFDHTFGNATLREGDIWGTPHCVEQLRDHGEEWKRRWTAEYDLPEVTIMPPNREVARSTTIEVGGRQVALGWHGRAHTAGDLVVCVDDTIICGDLVEEGASPQFDDAYPLDWPETLAAVLRMAGPETVVVPGHGAVAGREFLKSQHDDLTTLDWLIREGHGDGAPVERVAAASPFASYSLDQAIIAVRRGYAQLDVTLE